MLACVGTLALLGLVLFQPAGVGAASALFIGNITLFDGDNQIVGKHPFAINTTSLSNTTYESILSNCTPFSPTTTHVAGQTMALSSGAVFSEVYTEFGTNNTVGEFHGREVRLYDQDIIVVSANGWLGYPNTQVAHNGDTFVSPPNLSAVQRDGGESPVVRFYNKFSAGNFTGLEVLAMVPASSASTFSAFVSNHCSWA